MPESIQTEGLKGYIDITDSVECYQNGKAFNCECGQPFGLEHQEELVKCPTCGKICVDKKASEREAPSGKQQKKLEDYF